MRVTDSYSMVGVGRPKKTPLDSQLHASEVAHQINVLLANANAATWSIFSGLTS